MVKCKIHSCSCSNVSTEPKILVWSRSLCFYLYTFSLYECNTFGRIWLHINFRWNKSNTKKVVRLLRNEVEQREQGMKKYLSYKKNIFEISHVQNLTDHYDFLKILALCSLFLLSLHTQVRQKCNMRVKNRPL